MLRGETGSREVSFGPAEAPLDGKGGRGRGGGRNVFLLLLLLLLPLVSRCSRPGVGVGDQAPAFRLPSLDGRTVSLGELRGKVVILHFWATWCPPCMAELPSLLRFGKGLDPEKFVLLAVCVDNEDPARIRAFLRSWGPDLPVCLDPGGRVARRFGTYRYPETYILDPRGVIARKIIGQGDWERGGWAHILQKIARQRAGGEEG